MGKFIPDPLGDERDPDRLRQYVIEQFEKLSNVLDEKLDGTLQELGASPVKPREGMIVAANGTSWNPGAGKGAYIRLLGRWWPLAAVQTPDQPPPEEPPEEPPPGEEPGEPQPIPPEAGLAVPTFHCMGLYWTPPSPPANNRGILEYRLTGTSTWLRAHDMWYDARNNQCRGSVFWLDPDTEYDFQFSLVLGTPIGGLRQKTWSEVFPENPTPVTLPATRNTTLVITEGGTPTAYKVYKPAGASAVIDVNNAATNCVEVRAPYVIVRGLTLRGAQRNGVQGFSGAHHVVIENCDITGWGRLDTFHTGRNGFNVGISYDCGVKMLSQINCDCWVVQNNQVHDPRYGSSPWDTGHPVGPNGIHIDSAGRNHVIRWNSLRNSLANHHHFFQDAIGGELNFSNHGAPGPDSDIYGNYIQGVMDDAIEAEGSGRNVRIWGNYSDHAAVGVGTTVVHEGPIYVFRNIHNRARHYYNRSPDSDIRLYFSKAARNGSWGGGARYLYHNTLLQAMDPGNQLPSGLGIASSSLGSGQEQQNTTSRNNVWHTHINTLNIFPTDGGTGNSFDFDLYNANVPSGSEPNGIKALPTYQTGQGVVAEGTGKYRLQPGTSGYNAGEVIPNLNSLSYAGVAPDMGVHEDTAPDLVFGHTGGGKGAGEPL